MSDGAPVDFTRFRARRVRAALVASLERLRDAVERRDVATICHLLDAPRARRALPRAVRDEALEIGRLPVDVPRAPLRLLQFQHTLIELGDEPLGPAEEEDDEPPVREDGLVAPARILPFLRPARQGPWLRPRPRLDTRERPRSS